MLTAKRPQLRRLVLIDSQLRGGQYPSAEQLARLTEANVRTVRRDLEYLRDQLHAPLAFNAKCRGWHYTEPSFSLPNIQIAEGELVALFVAEQVLHQHRGTPYESLLTTALAKLAALLPDEVSIRWKTVEQAHSFRSSVVDHHNIDIFRRLAHAVLHQRQIRITYWTAAREVETTRVVDPWHLTCVDGAWYLLAYCHTRREPRMFAPARIRQLAETGESFEIPADFSVGQLFDGAFRVVGGRGGNVQRVRLRFSPPAAKYVREKIWHASQVSTPEPGGYLLVAFQLRSLTEIKRWVLGWGAACQVLEPPELRDEIVREARLIIRQRAAASRPVRNSPPRKKPK